MTLTAILSLAGGALSTALALVALIRKPRGIAQWSLAVGLLVFAAEAIFNGLAFLASNDDRILFFETCGLLASAGIPGPWLVFSLTYSRGNWQLFLRKWRLPLVAAFVVPAAIVIFFRQRCVLGLKVETPYGWDLQLAWPGSVLVMLVLLSSILVLMNLERTFRASVGTMRWLIKYMILGLALLFGVQVYASSQMLLYSGNTSSLAAVQ